jgi:CubicO group peptidase (beta-lactamase class C family)
MTFGWLVGEVVRQVSGKSLGTYFRETIAEPLGLDTHIGIGPEHDHRIAEMIAAEPTPEMMERRAQMAARLDAKLREAQGNIPMEPNGHNSEGWKRSEIPAANGHSDARSLARVYGALSMDGDIDGIHVLSPEAIAGATTEQAFGSDAMLMMKTRFAQGFWLSTEDAPMGPNSRNFGHPGAGGSVGFADPDRHIGFGYVMNQMKAGLLVEGTGKRLIDAVYASL